MDNPNRRRGRRGETRGGMGLPAVQSIIGGIVLLLALILRLIGGGVYGELQKAFHDAITDDTWAQTLADSFLEEAVTHD